MPAGAVVLAAQASLLEQPTTNRRFFGLALRAERKKAVALWHHCPEPGDSMVHYGLGYTLLELGRSRGAYGHLRTCVDICPTNAWAWCWLGKAHEALGERTDARAAYLRTVELDAATDAPELLTALAEGN